MGISYSSQTLIAILIHRYSKARLKVRYRKAEVMERILRISNPTVLAIHRREVIACDERTSSPVSPGLGYFLVFSWYS